MLKTNSELEEKLLAGLILDLDFLEKKLPSIDEGMFFYPKHKSLYTLISTYYAQYKGTVTQEVLNQYMDNANVPMATRLDYSELYIACTAMSIDHSELDYAVDELKKLKLLRSTSLLLSEATTALTVRDPLEVLINLETSLADLKKTREDSSVSRGFVSDNVDRRIQQYQDKKDGKGHGYFFGIPTLDELTDGIQKQELCLVSARSGAGKSRCLLNFGFNMTMAKYNVVYITIEMYTEQVERMFDSRATGLSYVKLRKGKLNEKEEQKYSKLLEWYKNNKLPFYIINIPRGCTVANIESEISQYERAYNKKVDVAIIDYLTLLMPQGHVKNENTPALYGDLMKSLKQMARIKKMAVITAGQLNRQSVGSKTVGLEHISLSDQITWHADMVFSLTQTEEEKLKNIINLSVIKYRDGMGMKIPMFAAWDMSYIGEANPYPNLVNGG